MKRGLIILAILAFVFTPIAGLMGKYYILPVDGRTARLTLKVKR